MAHWRMLAGGRRHNIMSNLLFCHILLIILVILLIVLNYNSYYCTLFFLNLAKSAKNG